MSTQTANLKYAHAGISGAEPDTHNRGIYTFNSGLQGTGFAFNFGLFALAQGKDDSQTETDTLLRHAARQLIREIYLRMLPWEAIERPNPLDVLTDVMALKMGDIGAAVIAIVVGPYVYLGWHGDGRAFLLTSTGVEPLVSEDNTQITSHQLAKGHHLLLCASGACPDLALDEMHQLVHQTPTLQAACDHLIDLMPAQEGEAAPLVLLIHYPD